MQPSYWPAVCHLTPRNRPGTYSEAPGSENLPLHNIIWGCHNSVSPTQPAPPLPTAVILHCLPSLQKATAALKWYHSQQLLVKQMGYLRFTETAFHFTSCQWHLGNVNTTLMKIRFYYMIIKNDYNKTLCITVEKLLYCNHYNSVWKVTKKSTSEYHKVPKSDTETALESSPSWTHAEGCNYGPVRLQSDKVTTEDSNSPVHRSVSFMHPHRKGAQPLWSLSPLLPLETSAKDRKIEALSHGAETTPFQGTGSAGEITGYGNNKKLIMDLCSFRLSWSYRLKCDRDSWKERPKYIPLET